MLKVFVGNDDVHMNEEVGNEYIVVDAEKVSPQEVWQPDLFATKKQLINYAKWTTKQRKEFVQLQNGELEVLVKASQIGKKDPLADQDIKTFYLPRNKAEWQEWIKQRAQKRGLSLQQKDLLALLSKIGENSWALDTEIQRWALLGTVPNTIFQTSEQTIWQWIESMLKGDIAYCNSIVAQLFEELPVFLMTASLGKRLFAQVMFFSGQECPAGVAPYTWQLVKQSKKWGWNLKNSQFWLKELLVLECTLKGDTKLSSHVYFVKWQNEFLQARF